MLSFIKQYVLHPRRVGAVAPSGKALAHKMIEPIDFQQARVLVEYGPGTGAFTQELLAHKHPDAILIAIEQNPEFCRMLRCKFSGKAQNFILVQDSVENLEAILLAHGLFSADYVVSGLPFSSLPSPVTHRILEATQHILGQGLFITFQYTKMKQQLLADRFAFQQVLRERANLPPAYVFVMQNKESVLQPAAAMASES